MAGSPNPIYVLHMAWMALVQFMLKLCPPHTMYIQTQLCSLVKTLSTNSTLHYGWMPLSGTQSCSSLLAFLQSPPHSTPAYRGQRLRPLLMLTLWSVSFSMFNSRRLHRLKKLQNQHLLNSTVGMQTGCCASTGSRVHY